MPAPKAKTSPTKANSSEMPSAADVDGDVLRTTVLDAICAMYRHEGQLVRERAHERSILFHIGRHLAAGLSGWPDPWDVDLEYNRADDAEKLERITKFLLATDGRQKRPVLPDLIIHRRGQTAVQANLLVMEAKKRECGDRAVDYDKLRGFRNEFGYRVAVYLELQPYPNPPEWLWMDGGEMSQRDFPPPSARLEALACVDQWSTR